MSELVLFEEADGVAVITLNRPQQRNAVNLELCEAMRAAFDRVENDGRIRVAVLMGAGGTFCAGMDLKAFAAGDGWGILFGAHGFGGFVKRKRTKPVIAAVAGAALAGGFELMLACDLVIATEDATFGLPEAKLGLVAGAGGALRLAQRIPRVHANEILLTGQPFSAAKAVEYGLLNDVVAADALRGRALELAARVASNAPMPVASTMALSEAAFRAQEDWPANDAELRALGQTQDSLEGALAFLEKRKPVWRGR
ncbi:MAG: enoyl-CoA hydratase-related protein [Rhodobacteraceae bacterium]|nr:enoyl-CoA hydratase-related protein [Paracoccaceae bacterium]